MSGTGNTTAAMLRRAVEIGREAGLQFVYAGNMPGAVGDLETTRCPQCQEPLVERYGYLIREYRLTADGSCPSCHAQIPGRWSPSFDGQAWAGGFARRLRLV
jgi:pyruvate formate lyase activating enzyme